MEQNIKSKFEDMVFDPEPHTYTKNGKNFKSVTTVIDEYTQEFDSDSISRKVAERDGLPQDEVLAKWAVARDYSCVLGTEMHLYIETFLMHNRKIETITGIEDRIIEFHKFWGKYSEILEIVDSEVMVYDEESQVAGTIDCIARNKKSGEYIILDWKTNKEIKESNRWQNMNSPFGHLEDCNFNHYSLQISVYCEILKKAFPDMKTEIGRLVYFPREKDYKILKIKDLSAEAKILLKREADGKA